MTTVLKKIFKDSSEWSAEEAQYFIGRLLFFWSCAIIVFLNPFHLWSHVPDLFYQPTSIYKIFGRSLHSLLTKEFFYIFKLLVVISLFCMGFTKGYRWLSALTFFCFMFLIGYRNNFHKVEHDKTMLVFTSFFILFSDWAFALNVSQKSICHWFIRSIKWMIVVLYFLAGIEKLRNTGFDWFLTDNLAAKTLTRSLLNYREWILSHLLLFKIFAFLTIAFEVLSPLALFLRGYWVLIFPVICILFHSGVAVIFNTNFLAGTLFFLFWIPWGLFLRRRETPQVKIPRWLWTPTVSFLVATLVCFVGEIESWPLTYMPMFSYNYLQLKHDRIRLIYGENGSRQLIPRTWIEPLTLRQFDRASRELMYNDKIEPRIILEKLSALICINRARYGVESIPFSLRLRRDFLPRIQDLKDQIPQKKLITQRMIDCSQLQP